MATLRTVSRAISLSTDPAKSRSSANIFATEPTSGSQARSRGSLYVVTESEGDSPEERAYCRLVADSIRVEYFRDTTQELDQALSHGIDRGNARMLKDDRLPPEGARPIVAMTCMAIRDGELAVAQTLPVQAYIGTQTGIALLPDPPFWESGRAGFAPSQCIGHSPLVSYELYTAKLSAGDIVTVCSSALAQSLTTERLEEWTTKGETRPLTQGMRTQYLRSDTEPAYALVVQAKPDARERASSPLDDEAKGRTAPRLPFQGASPVGDVLSRLGRGADSSAPPRSPSAASGAPLPRSGASGALSPRGAAGGSPPARTAPAGRRAGPPESRASTQRQDIRATANRRLVAGLIAGVVVLLVLLLLVKGVQRIQTAREHSAYLQLSGQVDQLLTQAAQQSDPAAANSTLQQAQDLVKRQQGGLTQADAAALTARIGQRQDALSKASRLGNVKLLVNLSTDPLAQLAQIVVQGPNLFILDTGGHRVLKVPAAGGPALAAMSAGIKVGSDTIQPLVAITATATGVLAVDSSNAVWSFDASNNQIRRVAMPGANAWGEIRAITNYRNDLYVLDGKLSRVWRYTPQGNGYSTPTDYFPAAAPAAVPSPTATVGRGTPTPTPAPTATPVPPPDLLHSVDLSVDGNVYILQSNGQVLKYTNGLPQPFPETGLVGSMPSPSHIEASLSDSSVYVVDPSGTRLVRFSTSGVFQRQYLLPTNAPSALTGIQSATIDAAHGLVYLISAKTVAVATLPNQ